MMKNETVTNQKITYPKNIPDGYMVLTIPDYTQETPLRLRIDHIECYYPPNVTEDHQQPSVGSFIRMVSGKGWCVKETPELIDALIHKFNSRPYTGPR